MDAQEFDTMVVRAGEIELNVILWLLLKYVFVTMAKITEGGTRYLNSA